MKLFMDMLKTETAGAHKDLETTPISKMIMSPHIDKSNYAEYLARIYNMHQAVEERTFQVIRPVIQDLSLRDKARHIIQDLESLDAPIPAVNTFFDEKYDVSINFNLGIMYVAEGSILGGQYILQNIRKVLGTSIACEYFKLYGPSTGVLWKGFCAQLNNYQRNLTVTEREEIVNGAIYGFQRAKSSLT